ncbi:MAG TPA: alanine racemase [Pirellulales bacterium]|jgi:D-serine deaminase-like pyridoxal phosphate-dependent protein|nr:alanine racemase [Pirellulales bacterium]
MAMEPSATPAMVVDARTVLRNVARLAEYAETHELDVRPHTKTHKSRQIADLQMAAGAIGLTAAKVGEAQLMSEVADDILLAYPAIDPARTARLVQLAAHATLRVAVDSIDGARLVGEAANRHSATVGILVDLDVGLHRTGVQSPGATLKIAQYVDSTAGLRLDGLFCYPGHINAPPGDQEPALTAVADQLAETLRLWYDHGLQARIVSGGSTPTAFQSHLVTDYTEIRPGTYVYNDMNTVRGGFCKLEDCAARIIATVVSTAVPGQVVIDAGSKTLTSDLCGPAPQSGHGHVVEYPDARIAKLSEEHAQIDIRDCQRAPQLGERLTIIPNHICPCVNLQDSVWWRDEDGALQELAIDARGMLI